jgi:hypothetical protein
VSCPILARIACDVGTAGIEGGDMAERRDPEFERRLKRIARPGEGAGEAGTARARRRGRVRIGWRYPLAVVLLAFATVKAAALATMGELNYAAQLAALDDGSFERQVAAAIMVPDAGSRAIAEMLKPLLP